MSKIAKHERSAVTTPESTSRPFGDWPFSMMWPALWGNRFLEVRIPLDHVQASARKIPVERS